MAVPSRIIKKSFPASPCFTTTSSSSNETASRESATVSRSHLSKFSAIKNNQGLEKDRQEMNFVQYVSSMKLAKKGISLVKRSKLLLGSSTKLYIHVIGVDQF